MGTNLGRGPATPAAWNRHQVKAKAIKVVWNHSKPATPKSSTRGQDTQLGASRVSHLGSSEFRRRAQLKIDRQLAGSIESKKQRSLDRIIATPRSRDSQEFTLDPAKEIVEKDLGFDRTQGEKLIIIHVSVGHAFVPLADLNIPVDQRSPVGDAAVRVEMNGDRRSCGFNSQGSGSNDDHFARTPGTRYGKNAEAPLPEMAKLGWKSRVEVVDYENDLDSAPYSIETQVIKNRQHGG